MIFIFSSCHEKTHDNKEFSREISKPRRDQISCCLCHKNSGLDQENAHQ